jgi:hypothetical protein
MNEYVQVINGGQGYVYSACIHILIWSASVLYYVAVQKHLLFE